MKEITKDWMKEKGACQIGIDYFAEHWKKEKPLVVIEQLIKDEKLDWANWVVARCMTTNQYVAYVDYATYVAVFVEVFTETKLKIIRYGIGLMRGGKFRKVK